MLEVALGSWRSGEIVGSCEVVKEVVGNCAGEVVVESGKSWECWRSRNLGSVGGRVKELTKWGSRGELGKL